MISREFVTSKPKLKLQIRRRYNHANIEFTDIESLPPAKTRSPFMLHNQIVLLDTCQVTSH
jgi:hypothetical protein